MAADRRRIVRRMILQKIDNLQEYAQYLKQNTNEIHQLYQDLLINVTNFFRDPEASEFLKKNLLPRSTKLKSSSASMIMNSLFPVR